MDEVSDRNPQEGRGRYPAPEERRRKGPIKVSLPVYLGSILLVALLVFVLMLVQYLSGFKASRKIAEVVENSQYVYVGVRVPKAELKKRNVNPLTKVDEVAELFCEMGAKRAKVEINPDTTEIPGEKKERQPTTPSEKRNDVQ
ncbi:MAG: hypothetical protein PHO53_04155 [Actinomycetota bacterium]|nr:hypothetical protein [Actinomycetota bacterium]